MILKTPHWLYAGFFLLTPNAQAQTQDFDVEAPAIIWQDQLRRLEQIPPARPAPRQPAPTAPQAVAPATSALVTLAEIQFSQTSLLSQDELRTLGLRYLGRALGTADLQALLDDISNLYRTKGVLTAVPVLPPQNLQSGLLRVLLVEGRLGRVKVRTPGGSDAPWVQRWFDLPTGEVVTNEALEARLALFNATSDLLAQADFVPGDRFGVSDLAIDIVPSPPAQFWALLETAHTQSAAPGLVALGWRKAPVSPNGGKLDTALIATEQGKTLMAGLSWPVDVQGWRAGINGSISRTRTKQAAIDGGTDLVLEGAASAAALEVGRTWILNNAWTLLSAAQLGRTESSIALAGVDLTDSRIDRFALTTTLNYETRPTRAALKTTLSTSKNADKHYRYLDIGAQAQTALDERGRWQVRIGGLARVASTGQSNANEQLSLGGADTVRGFDAGASTGDTGHAVQLELRYRYGEADAPATETYLFADSGQTHEASGRTRLGSVGVGLQARITPQLGLDLMASRQIKTAQERPNRWLLRLVGSW